MREKEARSGRTVEMSECGRHGERDSAAVRRGKSKRRSGGRCMVIGEQWRRMK